MSAFAFLMMTCVVFGDDVRFGPKNNRADLIRQMGGIGPLDRGFGVHERLLDMGFNTYSYHMPDTVWDFRQNKPTPELEKFLQLRKIFFDRLDRDGVSVIDAFPGARAKPMKELYPRRFADGSPDNKAVDASSSQVRKIICKLAETIGRQGSHPAVIGVEPANEVRFLSHFSFTPEAIQAYRTYAGRDLPDCIKSANGESVRFSPHWSTIRDFPLDRIVPDDYPLLDFYRWTWKTGDGWNAFLSEAYAAYLKGIGRDVFGMYSPALRTPAIWGTTGSIQALRNWEYPYPDPYRVAYTAAGLQSLARANDGLVLASVQSICYRSRLAPISEHPENEPAWTREFPNCLYPTAPADLVREGLWAVLARRVDGICTHGYDALIDMRELGERDENYRFGDICYRCADRGTASAVKEVFTQVLVPLGPLLRAVPEREPQVAVLASATSQILGGRITWNCQGGFFDAGVLAIAANLCPYAITEDEIVQRGIPQSVKVLILSECDVLTRSVHARIADFVRCGGRIVADESLTPALKADAVLPKVQMSLTATKSDHDDGAKAEFIEASVHHRAVRRAAQELKAIALKSMTPAADTDNEDILVHVRSCGDADYVFPLNDRRTYGDYVGPWKRVMEKGLPNYGTVVVPRKAGAVYDLVRHAAVPFEIRDGQTRIPVKFATCDGKVLMVTSKPLAKLEVLQNDTRVTVRSPDSNLMIPIEITGFGQPFYAVVKNGCCTHDFKKLPSTTVGVRNLANGERTHL